MQITVTGLALLFSVCISVPAETYGFLVTPSSPACAGQSPPTFSFQESIELPTPMNMTEFNQRVVGVLFHSLAIIPTSNPVPYLSHYATEVVHEQLRWTLLSDETIYKQSMYRPKLGAACVTSNDTDFRFTSNTSAVMEKQSHGVTRRDILFSRDPSYLIQYVCANTSQIENGRCGKDSVYIEYYTRHDVPDRVAWQFLSADLASIKITPDDKRSRWMYLDDRCPNALT